MEENNIQNLNQNLNQTAETQQENISSPDFSAIKEAPKSQKPKVYFYWILKILAVIVLLLIIMGVILGIAYYRNFKQAADLSFAAKANLELAVHKMVNRDFDQAAELIKQANGQLSESKELLDQVIIVRYLPYIGVQVRAVDDLLVAGINLTDSGEKVVLLIDDIIEPLQNESITYAQITPQQKKEILDKIVASKDLLVEVQQQIDEANDAIEKIPEEKLVKPLREGVVPLQENLPKIKMLIDHTVPMLSVIPQIVGFEEPKSYLFLLQNNNELRPTGGFIGTYGILKLKDGEIEEFETDNIYNLDRSTQKILKEPSPWPIAKYLEQKDWSLRDSNWSPDFPTAAQQALYFYDEENRILSELKEQGQQIVGDADVLIEDTIPYENVDGIIAMTPEIMEEVLKLTGPVVVDGVRFSADNLQDELEFQVGKRYFEQGIARSERKAIILKLADEVKLRLMTLPLQRVVDFLDVVFNAFDQKQVMIYSKDPELEQMVLDRNWGGEVHATDGDYLFVVDSNLASLKTDQYVSRFINYTLEQAGDKLKVKLDLTYQNDADFTWKSTRLRTYTRVYVPLGSELISSSGAMENDPVRLPEGGEGQVEVSQDLGKTVFGAFISIEPHEVGTLSFEYYLPDYIYDQLKNDQYSLLVQKQPGVIHNLTLDLNFDKTIKSADPAEPESEFFNRSYDLALPLDKDLNFNLSF